MGDEEAVRSEEFVNGGTDVLSSSRHSASSSDHLVVMVHGILGSTADWQYGADQFVKALPDKVIIHCSECNGYTLTLDGVDVMGERLAEEVIGVINRRPGLKKISFIAHSMGGLAARYAIGRLYRTSSGKLVGNPSDGVCAGDNTTGTIYGLEAMNFITVATPHLGSRGLSAIYRRYRHLSADKFHCFLVSLLLRRLQLPSALGAFKRRVAYANVGYDHIVGWRTSSIRHNSELAVWEDSSSKEYPHIVRVEHSKAVNADKCHEASDVSCYSDVLEEELVTGLSRVSWEKVDVSFQSSIQRFVAHNAIQVQYAFMHSEGADVIQHMIDHFIT
ncbi:putative lipase C4A8.10 isoform X2 [Asparagus officinalis]|uniref:putative lipase C4A8.10 isoform X2 n=1 Tax=Asparagus officinalis TaxID=4686 RepID=UPI00098DE971|nr:putative lipase C4A8.10 isoform X2 [Asparagus officinalis]